MTTARKPPSGNAGASTPPVRHVIGVMTGTSIDGIDIALARIEGRGLEMRVALAWHESQGLGELGSKLRQAAEQQPMTASELARLAWDFGLLHADAIAAALGKHEDAPSPDLIVAHGQTIFHEPPISWQLLNPAPIAARFDCPVICDLRQADLAAGGQGAPITPLADWILFRDARLRRAIVNLGGFCNVTVLPISPPPSEGGGRGVGEAHEQLASATSARHPHPNPPPQRGRGSMQDIRGFDVCACNHVLDAVARRALNGPYDKDGEAASGGRVINDASNSLFTVLSRQRDQRRSLGTRDEATSWIDSHLGSMCPADLAATAVDAIARCIAVALKEHRIDEVILAGGGALNRALTAAIAKHSGTATQRSDALGVPVQAREALCMAVLGALSSDGVPISSDSPATAPKLRLITIVPNAIEQQTIEALDSVRQEHAAKTLAYKDRLWTARSKQVMCHLGRSLGFQTYASSCEVAEGGEWLFDVVWLVMDGKQVRDVPLILESEWDRQGIMHDFPKLVVGRAATRVMVFQAASESSFKKNLEVMQDEILQSNQTRDGDRYLFICWLWKTEYFVHRCIQVTSPRRMGHWTGITAGF